MPLQLIAEEKGHVLVIRCSDGFTKLPSELNGNTVHEIRKPGGVLFPDLCANYQLRKQPWVVRRLLGGVAGWTSRLAFFFAIETMVDLKKPVTIILMGHAPCGAAGALGLTGTKVARRLCWWQERLTKRFPTIAIKIATERHSACGTEHYGHEELPVLQAV